MARLLLVEFAVIDRFHRAIAFPFVRGYLREAGIENRWIRFGVPASIRSHHAGSGFGLDPADRATLIDLTRSLRPTHVLFSHYPSSGLVDAIRAEFPGTRAAFVDDTELDEVDVDTDPVPRLPALVRTIERFLDLAPSDDEGPGANPFDRFAPDFGWEPANRAAREAPSLPFLVCGEGCTYRKSLRGNSLFDGLDLSECAQPNGCSFCVRPPGRAHWTHGPVDLFRIQIESLARTHAPWVEPLAVRAMGEPILGHIDAVAECLSTLEIGPVELLIDGRVDAIVRHRDSLRRAVLRLLPTRHAIHFALAGIESFSAAMLQVLNKGVGWAENFEAIEVLLGLEAEHPAHFVFRSHGGLSLLLQTPWTRLQDLALDLAVIRRARILPFCGKVFTSRLRLYPSLPLHALAKRDGLILEEYDDPVLDTARRNFYRDEVAWRFLDPRLEPVSRILLRLDDSAHDQDALSREVRELTSRIHDGDGRLAFAEEVLATAMDEEHRDPTGLLHRAAERHFARPAVSRTGGDPLDHLVAESTRVAFASGLKPVVRVEEPSPDMLSGNVSLAFGNGTIARTRSRRFGPDTGTELFFGRHVADVDEAIALTDRIEGPGIAHAEWVEAASRVGVLLGYPQCCATAFASHPRGMRDIYNWLYIKARLDEPGEVSPLLNPGAGWIVDYIPCSLRCEATLDRAQRLFEALRSQRSPAAVDEFERRLRRPWLLFPDHQHVAVELITEADPAGRFSFRGGAVVGSDPVAMQVAQGDEIELDEQHLVVLRRGKLHAALGGRAFVWWHRAPVQREFWSRLFALRFGPRLVDETPQVEIEAPAPGADAAQLARIMAAWLRIGTERPLALGEFIASAVEPVGLHGARITLQSSTGRFRVEIAPRSPDDRVYASAGPLGIFHPKGEPIERANQDLAVRVLAKAIDTAWRKRSRVAR